ncbi:tetratricopeptide repeat protein [Pedobacter sp. SG908]|uniref:tetratricopeptide repeat protein n=1 Tax=Pedobacter sp. SG908 TaxID=2587135 RepID=UPI0014228CDB|nr:tetratricopeptide repeat protein [Pedobacter sp. SG908]NII83255.1 hypothetical protein [Pedobacter sp. SG908]
MQQQNIADLEHLQSIYNSGNYAECLEAVNLFLLFNPDSRDGLLLKGKCAFELSYNSEDAGNMLEVAISSFEELLKLAPGHEEAMLFIAYINICIRGTNLSESIAYCNQLAISNLLDTRIKAIQYRQEAYYQSGDIDHALADLDLLINISKENISEDRGRADYEIGVLYTKKAALYLEHKNDPSNALRAYQEGLPFRHKDVRVYCLFAHLALDNQDYELGGKVAQIALFMGDADEELIKLYFRLDELTREGIISQSIIYAMFIALKIYKERVNGGTVELLSLAQRYIKTYPNWSVPYHYAGAALYEVKSYHEALPYLQKSIELGGLALGLQRFIEISYRINSELPSIKEWPEDAAVMYYNAGVSFFYESEAEIRTKSNARELLQIRAGFYKISYDAFCNYFYNGKGDSGDNEPHIFAMCCNNYGIALSELGDYENAIEIHKRGYALSPFWEQLYSLSVALLATQRYQEAVDVLEQAMAYGSDYLSFEDYIDLKGKYLTAIYGLGLKEEAKAHLTEVEEEYNNFIKTYGNGLTERGLFTLSEKYIVVQNVRHDLLSEGSLEDATRRWKDELDKNPDDNSSWYMLMQNYYQLKDYHQCIACANNYQSIKGEAITVDSVQKVYFMRGMSYLFLEDYNRAKENLNILLGTCQPPVNESDESIACNTNLSLAQCSYALKEWDESIDYSLAAIACYDRNGWRCDDTWIKAALQYADGCKAAGEVDAAIETVNNILKIAPQNEEALKRKREWKRGGLFSFLKRG